MKRLGSYGEEIAVMFLVKRGYSILERNYRLNFAEIDIIARKDETIHFIEVKTVSRGTYRGNVIHETPKDGRYTLKNVIHETSGHRAEDNVNDIKVGKIAKLGEFYVNKYYPDHECQIDVITVSIDKSRGFIKDIIKLSFIENI